MNTQTESMKACGIDANEVSVNLWVGAHPRHARKGWHHSFDHIYFVASECPPPVEVPVRKAHHFSLIDSELTPTELCKLGIPKIGKSIAEKLSQGAKVLVTCHMGHNRSALVAGAALVALGVSGTSAVQRIMRVREYAFGNEAFRKFVEADCKCSP